MRAAAGTPPRAAWARPATDGLPFPPPVPPGALPRPGSQYNLTGDLSARECRCRRCGSHLGHVFGDGAIWDVPTGKRYCMNGVSLAFTPSSV